ncbi:DUF1189 domain-containing protein [Mangrovibacillus cuniculi]|uniref:DUF1189 domain-containing protein n=1 Tax=Mangrovibacillus cuniculi TaxID=2593652 RepID=A0A7S8CBE2_9BACI|nr:DUF1189 domain-containing protein [Mangrovibacillus cuniculi]QPC46892.1 DUF1189 domain-containing protein [Mangrovibacillus cuniculi]
MSVWKAFSKSIYSFKHIGMFRMLPIGKAISHLFLLLFITSLPAIIYTSMMTSSLSEVVPKALNDFSNELVIKNGQLESTKEKVEIDGWTIKVDPLVELEETSSDSRKLILSNDSVHIFDGNNKPVQTFSYQLLGGNVTGDQISQYLESEKATFWIMLGIFFSIYYLFMTFLAFIKVTIFSWITTLIGTFSKRTIPFRFAFRIATYSLTIPTLLYMIFDMLQWVPPSIIGLAIQYGLYLLVITLSVNTLPKPKHKQTKAALN